MTKEVSFHYLEIVNGRPVRVRAVYSDGRKVKPSSDKCSCGKYSGGGKCWECKQTEPYSHIHLHDGDDDKFKKENY